MNDKPISNYQENGLKTIIESLGDSIGAHNEIVARKIRLALNQLSMADSIENFQQIGIIIRDSWTEFSQSIYTVDFLPDGVDAPSPTHAMKMTEYVLQATRESSDHLLRISKSAYDLCNKLQHDINATRGMAIQCISMTCLCMSLILDSMARNQLLVKRPYYKCPNCGSLRLETREQWVPDIDSAFKVDKLICTECGWFYIEEMGGMSGIE